MTAFRLSMTRAFAALGILFAPAAINTATAQTATAPATFTLSNGLHVVVIPDRRTPVVTQMIWYKVAPPTRRRASQAWRIFSNT